MKETAENLHKAVRRTVVALSHVRAEIDASDLRIRRSVLLNLDVQLRGLLVLDRELRAGEPTRRVWSLGQASIPVLSLSLKSVEKQACDRQLPSIDECRQSVSALGNALSDFAEDR